MHINKFEFNKLELVGKGCDGVVRKYNNLSLKKIKMFDQNVKATIEAQYGIENNSFLFPIEKLYFDSIFGSRYGGYIYHYFDGNIVCRLDINDLEQTLQYIKKLEEDIIDISHKKIVVFDLWKNNCLFKNGFVFIDTTRYRMLNEPFDFILKSNTVSLNYFLSRLLFTNNSNNHDYTEYFKFLKFISRYKKLETMYDNLSNTNKTNKFSEFLKCLIDEIDVKTIDEYRNKVLTIR